VYATGESANLEESDFYEKIRQGNHVAKNIVNDSKLLKKYSAKSRKVFKIGEYGVIISDGNAYINKSLKHLVTFRKMKYRLKLRIKTLKA